MGWAYFDHCERSSADLVRAEFTQTEPSSGGWTWGVEDMANRGNTFYVLCRNHNPKTLETRYYVTVVLTQRARGRFGYKAIDEACGPFYCDCPKRILRKLIELGDCAAPINQHAADWRARCWAKLDKPRKTHKAGDTVKLASWTYTLIEPAGPRMGWRVQRSDGSLWRMNTRQLARSVPA